MADLGYMTRRVVAEMRRGDLTATSTAVRRAVADAISYFSPKRFWFNEFTNTAHTTVAASEEVTISTSLRIVSLDSVLITVSGREYPLDPVTFQHIDRIDSGQWQGFPEVYAWFRDRLRLYPTPNGEYKLTLSGIRRLTEVTASAASSASNAWTNEPIVADAVRMHAKGVLFRDRLRNGQQAQIMFAEAESYYRRSLGLTGGRARSGFVRPTSW